MTKAVKAKVILAAPIVGSTTHDRVIVELESGEWQVGKQMRDDRSTFEREFSMSMQDLLYAAKCGFEGSSDVSKLFGGAPGKGLAAGILLMAMAINVVNTDHAVDVEG